MARRRPRSRASRLMKLLVDMNLSPRWIAHLVESGWEAVHWSTVGKGNASDSEIMAYAAENDCIVLTHDLDFSAILAATHGQKPSVVQIRNRRHQLAVFRSTSHRGNTSTASGTRGRGPGHSWSAQLASPHVTPNPREILILTPASPKLANPGHISRYGYRLTKARGFTTMV